MDDLRSFRDRLDDVDAQILRLFGERFDICRAVARYKKSNGVPMMQPGRVDEVRERYLRLGAEHGMPEGFAGALFDVVIDASCRLEDDIIGSHDAGSRR